MWISKSLSGMLLSKAQCVHGWDLASTYVLCLLSCSFPVFWTDGQTEVHVEREEEKQIIIRAGHITQCVSYTIKM